MISEPDTEYVTHDPVNNPLYNVTLNLTGGGSPKFYRVTGEQVTKWRQDFTRALSVKGIIYFEWGGDFYAIPSDKIQYMYVNKRQTIGD